MTVLFVRISANKNDKELHLAHDEGCLQLSRFVKLHFPLVETLRFWFLPLRLASSSSENTLRKFLICGDLAERVVRNGKKKKMTNLPCLTPPLSTPTTGNSVNAMLC